MTPKLRDEMMTLKGKLEALQFTLFRNENTHGVYDLLDSICNEYDAILKQLCEGYRNE